jgi:hypothetical protein
MPAAQFTDDRAMKSAAVFYAPQTESSRLFPDTGSEVPHKWHPTAACR